MQSRATTTDVLRCLMTSMLRILLTCELMSHYSRRIDKGVDVADVAGASTVEAANRQLGSLSPEALRAVFRVWPTGVAVVAGHENAVAVGMTCNSLTSVSLDPPLLGFCVAKSSRTWPRLRRAGRFCVNVLAGNQEEICQAFAQRGSDRFRGIRWRARGSGPAIAGALAWLDCSLHGETDAGDHTFVLASVLDAETARAGDPPLVFHAGGFATVGRTGATS